MTSPTHPVETPRTNAFSEELPYPPEWADFARELERELVEAKEALEWIIGLNYFSPGIVNHIGCPAIIKRMLEEGK